MWVEPFQVLGSGSNEKGGVVQTLVGMHYFMAFLSVVAV